jgi:hypothetical protein
MDCIYKYNDNSKIYHLIYDIYNKDRDIEVYIFFCILSIFETNHPDKIYFHYSYLPVSNGKLWNIIINKLGNIFILKKIKIEKNFDNNGIVNHDFKKGLILSILNEYGGIYIKNNCILLGELENNGLNKLNKSNELIETLCMTSYYTSIDYVNYFRTCDIDILFKEIYDYNFSTYFYIIRDSNIVYLDIDNNDLMKLSIHDIFNKTTIYNLLIRNILTYSFINNKPINPFSNDISIENNRINEINYKLINNIDIILWINLDKSTKRRINMENILSNFDIINKRIDAIDGGIIENISNKYFKCQEENEYPKFSNKEYAILATHLKAIDEYCNIDEGSIKYGIALICEDDLSLDFYKYWKKDIKSIIEEAPDDWEIILLGYFSLNLDRKESFSKWNNEWSAISYLVRREKVKEKICFLKDIYSDRWLCNKYDLMVSDNYIFSKFKTYVYKYPYFTFPDDNDSTFHEDHINYHKIYKQSNYIILEEIYDYYIL